MAHPFITNVDIMLSHNTYKKEIKMTKSMQYIDLMPNEYKAIANNYAKDFNTMSNENIIKEYDCKKRNFT